MKAKTDRKSSQIAGIGKPAGNKNVDDRANIDTMRSLLSAARSQPNQFQGAATDDDMRLEFS